ncbi:MAG: protein kinase [Acidimicrobiia bacterium]|nr:protein kinase [Acidimicrobiia bacterium]
MTSWASPTDGSGASATPGLLLADRYELTEPIASGGMAQVWSATDVVLDRSVAAKILHPHLAIDAGFVERFRREAVAAASLSHSSIVSIYDTISQGGLEAIVMELIDGRTLRSILDEIGAMPAVDVVHFGSHIASALDEAHRAGIVHRDIKPANIMICPDRRVTVTDFGIAKAGTDADLTQTGTLLGTAKYLAPEQVTGAPIDPRSDLYALGVVMFEALTGIVPFKANTDAATALARLHQDPPPVRSLRPNVSVELATVVHRLMERDPNRRYARAAALRDALLALGSATGDPNLPVDATNDNPRRPVPPLPPATTADDGRYRQPRPAAVGLDHVTAPPAERSHQPGASRSPGPPNRVAVPSATGRVEDPVSLNGPVARRARRARRSVPSRGDLQIPGQGEFQVLGVEPPGSGSSTLSSGRIVRSKRSRLVPLTLIGVAVVGLIVAGVALTDVETRMGIGPDEVNLLDESGRGLAIAQITSFDPQTLDAEKEELERLTPLAADGDLGTAWTTETYRRSELGGLKDGVGLLIEIEERLPLNRIELDTNTAGWFAELYVGDSFADDGSDWGAPVALVEAGSNRVVRELGRAEGKVVLIWITDTGLSGERFRFELAEVAIR